MSRKKSHVGHNSKGSLKRRLLDGLDGTASPCKAQGARPSREATGVSPIEHIEHLKYLKKRWIDLACASLPAGTHAVRVHREGVPEGGCGGSCSARRTSKVDERQAQVCAHTQGEHDSAKFGAMIRLVSATPPV
ncbi:hypothetical protein T492DRAFT_851334 [Pavlovales sp. CCMP2436]|nr:hypothetical protein T492DRAFT_851334 [Pavlovales sp. CCMP2436]